MFFIAKAKKLPSGNWRVNQYIKTDKNGKRIYKSFTASSKKEDEYLASEYLLSNKKNLKNIKLSDAISQYIDSKSNVLSPSTIRGYRIMERNAFSDIADINILDLDDMTLQIWANNNAIKYSWKSIRNQYGFLVSVLKQNKVSVGEIALKPKSKTDYIVPDIEQMKQIIQAVKDTKIEIPILFALLLGLRQSEIAALKWENYKNGKILIKGAIVPNENNKLVEKAENKSYTSTRELDVPDYLKNKLEIIKKDFGYISSLHPSTVLKNFHSVCEKNNLPKFKVHALRHANASLMLLQGVSDKYAMERLGQSTPHMIKNVYQHTFEEEQKKISEKLNSKINELI